MNGGGFSRVHAYLVMTDDNTKIFNFWCVEYAFFRFKEEVVVAKYLQYFFDDLCVVFMIVGEDEYVVHVNCNMSLCNKVAENVIHKRLECGRRIGESEKHNGGFEKSFVGAEGGFPFVSFFNSNVIVSPTYVHFRENFSISKLVNEFTDQREWIVIFDRDVVKFAAILCRA